MTEDAAVNGAATNREEPDGAGPDGAEPAPARPAPGGRRGALVTELGTELRGYRAELRTVRADTEKLAGMVADNAGLLSRVAPRVGELGEEITGLGERVDALAERVAELGAAGAIDWPALDPAAAAAEWNALGEWVATVLGPFYEPTRNELPDCWARHRPAVVELVWLRRTYVAAAAPTARPGASAEWHVRWRPAAMDRVRAVIPRFRCFPGRHLDTGEPLPTVPYPGASAGPNPPPQPRTSSTDAREEVTAPAYWMQNYRAAVTADLAWRERRAAAATAAPGQH